MYLTIYVSLCIKSYIIRSLLCKLYNRYIQNLMKDYDMLHAYYAYYAMQNSYNSIHTHIYTCIYIYIYIYIYINIYVYIINILL